MKHKEIPAPLINAIRRQLPDLQGGYIEGDDVYLLTSDRAIHFIATEDVKTAIRVCESNLNDEEKTEFLISKQLVLLAPC